MHGPEKSLPITLPAAEATPTSEFNPISYLDQLRGFIRDNSIAIKAPVPPKIGAQIYFEEERSQQFLNDYMQDPTAMPTQAKQEWQYLGDSFTTAMGRVVKTTCRAEQKGLGLIPFHDLEPGQQNTVRGQIFNDIVEIAAVLSGDKPSKTLYQAMPVLYQSPAYLKKLVEDNPDFSRGEITNLVISRPLDPAEAIAATRQNIASSVAKYPTLSLGSIRHAVVSARNNFDDAIRRAASKEGINLEAATEHQDIAADVFLGALQRAFRERAYKLSHLNSTSQAHEQALEIAEEAAGFAESELLASTPDNMSAEDRALILSGFQEKIRLLSLLSDKAWRKGDLPISVARQAEEFRYNLYALTLGQFVTLQSIMGDNVSDFSNKHNPVLYADPEMIATVMEANSDISNSHLILLITRNKEDPQAGIDGFRERTQAIMDANPRILLREARELALSRPLRPIHEANSPDEPLIEPIDFLPAIREYLNSDARLGKGLAKDISFELSERIPEINEFYEAQGWIFGGRELLPAERKALLKKAHDLIVASERAYRKQELPNRLRDYDTEQRQVVYGQLADNFTATVDLLNLKSELELAKTPVLYSHAKELESLRQQYPEFSPEKFKSIILNNLNSIPTVFKTITQTRDDLKARYPGLTSAFATTVAISSPRTAEEKVRAYIDKVTEREFRRFNSRKGIPAARKKPRQLLKSLQTQFRNGNMGTFVRLTGEKQQARQELSRRAAHWLDKRDATMSTAYKTQFLQQIDRYIWCAETVAHDQEDYPSLLRLPATVQNRFLGMVYDNHVAISQHIAEVRDAEPQLLVTNFGFYHSAGYLESLLKQYKAYFKPQLIVYAAIAAPEKPYELLNHLVGQRADMVKKSPEVTDQEMHVALAAKIKQETAK